MRFSCTLRRTHGLRVKDEDDERAAIGEAFEAVTKAVDTLGFGNLMTSEQSIYEKAKHASNEFSANSWTHRAELLMVLTFRGLER